MAHNTEKFYMYLLIICRFFLGNVCSCFLFIFRLNCLCYCHFTVEFQAFFHIFHIQILCQICGFGIKSSLPLDLENWFSFRKLFEEKSFTVFYLYKSMIHFCWFLYKMWSRFVTFNCAYPVVPATFVGKAVFIELFLNLCQQTIEHICIIFLGSLFCSLSYVFIPLPRSQNGC